MRIKRPLDILVAATALVFLTSSFDIFLTVNLGPTVRVAQLIVLLLLAAALLSHRMGLTMEVPLGGQYLLAWWCVQLAFAPVAEFWQKSFAYVMWLGLNIALTFALVNLFTSKRGQIDTLLRLYLFSYVFVAFFGVLQFVLPVIGGPSLLVQQWWLPGRLPRASGFSYEPSYYATYLIMGIVTLGSLRRSGVTEFRSRKWTFGYLLMILAMVLSSSRMGIVFLILELAITPMRRMWKILKAPKLLLSIRVSGWRVVVAATMMCCIYIAIRETVNWVSENLQAVVFLVNGTGLLGTSSLSVDDRGDHFKDTMRIIVDHPLIGRSLGGITETVAGYSGVTPHTFEEAKDYEGQAVFAEVVAASGLLGAIPFFCFVAVTIAAPLRRANHSWPIQAAWLRALVLALVFEWAILQFNQNILRLYLWVHIAVLATVFAAVRHSSTERSQSHSGTEFPSAGLLS